MRAARAYRRFAAHGLAQSEAALTRDITTGFYNVLLARAAVAVEQESVDHLRAFVAQAKGQLSDRDALRLYCLMILNTNEFVYID